MLEEILRNDLQIERNHELQRDIKVLEDKLSDYMRTTRTRREKMDSLKEKVSSLESLNEYLVKENDSLVTENEEKDERINNLQGEVEELRGLLNMFIED